MAEKLIAIIAMVFFAGPAMADEPAKLDDKTLVVKTYNLKSFLGKKGATNAIPDMDAAVKAILKETSLKELKGGVDEPRILEIDRFTLEVRATAKVQAEVAALIDSLRGQADLAIEIKTELVELDPAVFEKTIKPLTRQPLGRTDSPLMYLRAEAGERKDNEEDLSSIVAADNVAKAGTVLQHSTYSYVNGREATLSKRQIVTTYTVKSHAAKGEAQEPLLIKDGFSLTGIPLVSRDRRFVRFKLTEQSSEFVTMKQREVIQFGVPRERQFQTTGPEISEYGSTGSMEVEDGKALLFRLAYSPSDKIWVVVIQPRIIIQSEEIARTGKKRKKPINDLEKPVLPTLP